MIRIGLMVSILLLVGAYSRSGSEDLRSTGRSLYSSLCQRCHGESGDATGYPGITPLSGITLRIPSHEIPTLSAPFVGRTFEGRDAQALIAHLETLKGEKGFERPGYLITPHLLEKKLGLTRDYRIIDTRPQTDYRAGHIPNAVALQGTPPLREQGWLGQLGVAPDTFVVVYDGRGGPRAATVWWAVHNTGHKRVAVLDGGFENWTSLAYEAPKAPSTFAAITYPAGGVSAAPPAGCESWHEKTLWLGNAAGSEGPWFDWRRTLAENGFLAAAEVRAYLKSVGIAGPCRYVLRGNQEEAAYLVFLLHLLGETPYVPPAVDFICLPTSGVPSQELP